ALVVPWSARKMYRVWSFEFVITLPIFVFSTLTTAPLDAHTAAAVTRASDITNARLRMRRIVKPPLLEGLRTRMYGRDACADAGRPLRPFWSRFCHRRNCN